MPMHSLLAGQCELGTRSLCAEGVHSPVKPAVFKMNGGVFGGTIMATFMYDPNYTHRYAAWRDRRINQCSQKNSVSLFSNSYFGG